MLDFIGRLTATSIGIRWWYAAGTFFALWLVFFSPDIFADARCTGKFVAFIRLSSAFDILYTVYYAAAILIGILRSAQALRRKQAPAKALRWILIGYGTLLIPTFVIHLLVLTDPDGFASIFCGFAVLLALILFGKVLPSVPRSRLRP
jgi:hypothetical protein